MYQISHYFTVGPFWAFKSLVAILLAAACFSCVPAIWMFPEIDLPPAYKLKSEHPLADTAVLTIPEHSGERSHGAKLTPRVLSSFLLYVGMSLSLHPYVPATLGGIVFLLSGIIVGERISHDRVVGFMTGLVFAGLYASNACFSVNFGPKPFDGIAIGMVALTLLLMDRPWLLAFSAYLACWTDERAIISLCLIAVVCTFREGHYIKSRCLILAAAVVVYFVTRMILSSMLGWTSVDASMIGDNLVTATSYTQMAAWTCFEGGWVIIAVAVWLGLQVTPKRDCIILVVATLFAIASCLIVLDISRAAAFSFPLILAALAMLKKYSGDETQTIRRMTAVAAIISLVSGNVEIISSIAFQPLPTTPIVLLLSWANP